MQRHDTHPPTHRRPVEVIVPSTVTSTSTDGVEQTHTVWSMGSLAGRITAVLGVVLVAIEALLVTRFTLAAFGANPANGFVDFIYDVSWPFVRPFADAFTNRTWDEGVIELGTLLAMGVYLVAFVVVAMLINALVPNTEAGGERIERRRVTRY